MSFYFSVLILIVGLVLFLFSYLILNRVEKIRIEKDEQTEKLELEKAKLVSEVNNLYNSKNELVSDINKKRREFNNDLDKEKERVSEQLEIYKQNIDNAKEQYFETIEKGLHSAEGKFDTEIQKYKLELEEANKELDKVRNTLSAAAEASLREREKKDNLKFYMLSVSPIELEDIEKLNTLKLSLHNPVLLSKLIWSTYFQKQTIDLCNRILGKGTVCGIYKITNINTQEVYIGQSVNIQDRIKQHIKCGLGIDAPSTNKLYKAMQLEGIWNFSFELIEKCKRDELNEKEKQWIELYKTKELGYNATAGNH